jgi:DNA polymerase-4
VTLKVKYSDFRLLTRSATLETSTNDAGVIYTTCCELLKKTEAGKRPVRLLGIYLSRLTSPCGNGQMSLLADEEGRRRRAQLHDALDRLADRFGEDAILPGTLLDKPER